MLKHSSINPSPGRGHALGRFDLLRLLGKSTGTTAWLAVDRANGREVMLTLPRSVPAGGNALEAWIEQARRAARLEHPNLATVGEVGVQDQWPYLMVARDDRVTLDDWCAATPNLAVTDIAGLLCGMLRGLAYAHDAGAWHGDPQTYSVLVDRRGEVQVMGLGASGPARFSAGFSPSGPPSPLAMNLGELRMQRRLAERDVLACGLLLHRLLGGAPPFGTADTAEVIGRLAPAGHEVLRLPYQTPSPVPDAMRAIVNRATSSQERLRYRSARTLLGALSGWHTAVSENHQGPLEILLGRLQSVGHLPALPGRGARVARWVSMEGHRTDEIAGEILADPALSLELLRTLNTVRMQGLQVADKETVLTLRRVVALIGVNGLRRAAQGLRAWPGPLGEEAAIQLRRAIDQALLAGHLAQRLRPAGYDPEVIFLIAVLQNLGRLVVRYHFSEEARQIDELMRPAPQPGGAPREGLDEGTAAFSVLGVDIGSMGAAVARAWGLGADVLHLMRRTPADSAVRKPDTEPELLRIVASAANETVELLASVPGIRVVVALDRLAERYSRVLRLGGRDFHEALKGAREALHQGTLSAQTGQAFPAFTAPATLDG